MKHGDSKVKDQTLAFLTLAAPGLAPSTREDCKDRDSAEKPLGMLRRAQHERKNSNDFNRSSVRPEALEG
jgi:hypothetical protein